MPIIKSAPRRKIGHWKPYYFNNSKRGIKHTADLGIDWHDWDHGLSKNGFWRIGHGAPERVLLKSGRMRDYTSAQLDKLRYRSFFVGRPSGFYRYARDIGVNVEIEPKGNDPRYKNPKYWNNLARLCIKVWGADWRDHVYVKVANYAGTEFAVRVIQAASSAGFPAGPLRDWNVPDKYVN